MTTASRWDFTDTVTLWPVTRDEYNQPQYGTAVTVACSWMTGGKLTRDNTGQEFVPGSTVWIEQGTSVAVGWRMVIGTVTGTPPSNAEVIRKVMGWNANTQSWGAGDVALVTG